MLFRFRLLYILLLIHFFVSVAFASKCSEPNYDRELILELNLGKHNLTNELFAYSNSDENILYPITEIFKLLDIKFKYKDKSLDAFVYESNNSIFIDYEMDILNFNGKKYSKKDFLELIKDEKLACYEDTIYMQKSYLEELLKAKIIYSKEYLRAIISTKETLPVNIKIKQYELSNNKAIKENINELTWFDSLKQRYNGDINEINNNDILSLYLVSLQVKLDKRQTKQSNHNIRFKTNMRLIDHDIDLMINKRKNKKEIINLKAKKTILDEQIRPYLTKYTFGDTSTQSGTLGSYSGKGINFTNKKNNIVSNDTIDLSGVLPSDWFIELFINDKLESFGKSNEFNRYEFNNIKLKNGINTVKFIFYGPQGQIDEKIEKYILNRASKEKGNFWYNFDYVYDYNNKKYKAINLSTQYGLNNYILINTQFLSKTTLKENNSNINPYTNTMADIKIKYEPNKSLSLILESPFYINDIEKRALISQLDYKPTKNISKITLKYNKYTSSYSTLNSKKNPNDSFDFSTYIPIPFTKEKIYISKRFIFNKEQNRTDIYNKYSLSSKITKNFNIKINYSERDFKNEKNYNMQLSYKQKKSSHKISIESVENKKENGIKKIKYNNTTTINKMFKFTFEASRYNMKKKYSANSSLSYNNNSFTTTLNLAKDTIGLYRVGMTFKTNLVNYNKSIYTPMMIRNASLYKSIAIIDVLLVDEDYQTIKRINNVLVRLGKKNIDLKDDLYLKTDNNSTIVQNIKPYETMQVELVEDSIQDISWKLISKPIELVFYPGKVEHFTFFVQQTGEIDGLITFDDENGTKPLANVKVNLVDMIGDVVDSTFSEYDGYYLFSQISSDRYRVEVDKKSLINNNLVPYETNSIFINKNKLFYFGNDLKYKSKE